MNLLLNYFAPIIIKCQLTIYCSFVCNGSSLNCPARVLEGRKSQVAAFVIFLQVTEYPRQYQAVEEPLQNKAIEVRN